ALHDEIEYAAVLAGGKIEPGLLLVVHEERRCLFLVERRQALELAPRAYELHALAHDLRNRKPGFQLVQELGREAHGFLAESAVHPRLFPISAICGASRGILSPLDTAIHHALRATYGRNSDGDSVF